MDNCVVDGWETFKGWTPYLVAIGVFIVWHLQKAKEVISNEAKNCIMDIVSQINLIDSMRRNLRNSLSRSTEYDYKNDLNELIIISKRIGRSISFINLERSILDREIVEKYFERVNFCLLNYEKFYKDIPYSQEFENELFQEYAIIHELSYKILKKLNKVATYKIFMTKAYRHTAPHT